eukprot:jgi/Ulvmu1/11264/UM073_0036.1
MSVGDAAPNDSNENAGSVDVLEDPALQSFVDPSFDSTQYASSVLKNPKVSAAEKTHMLQAWINRLDEAIREEVTSKHEELFAHVRQLQVSDRSLQAIKGSVTSFHEDLKQLKTEAQGPFQLMTQHSTEPCNLHDTLQLLRAVNSRMKLTGKLQQVMQQSSKLEPMDLAKAAKLVHDIEAGAPASELAGIMLIEQSDPFVQSSQERVMAAAHDLLTGGLRAQSQAEVASALQIFFNAGCLKRVVLDAVEAYAAEADEALRAATDSRRLGGLAAQAAPKGSTRQGQVRVAEVLWSELGTCMKKLQDAAVVVWHLQRVVNKKRDPLTLAAFVDAVQGADGPTLVDTFWQQVATVFAQTLQQTHARGGAVRDTLAHSFPRFLNLVESMLDKAARETEAPGAAPGVAATHRAALLRSMLPFQEASLSASVARMQQAVAALYVPGVRMPPSAVPQCIATLHEELKAAQQSASLAPLAAVALSRALAQLCSRAAAAAAPAADLRDVSGVASPAQLRAIATCSQLHEVHRSFAAQLPKLPPAAAEVLCDALEHVQSHALEAVLPLFRAVADEAETLLLGVHDVDWAAAAAEGGAVARPSSYVLRLADVLRRFRADFLAHFVPQPSPSVASFAALLCQRLAGRAVAFLVRHAAMLKPLPQEAKLQLAKDMAELEAVLRASVYPPDLLREPHAVLRGFRTLLFVDNSALDGATAVSALPRVTVLLHLFARLPPAVKLPHRRTGVSAAQYSTWLDQHSPEEAVESIRHTLTTADLGAADQHVAAMINKLLAA